MAGHIEPTERMHEMMNVSAQFFLLFIRVQLPNPENAATQSEWVFLSHSNQQDSPSHVVYLIKLTVEVSQYSLSLKFRQVFLLSCFET